MGENQGLNAAFDTTKQFITLSTGILALTITFADKFKASDNMLSVPGALKIAWIVYIVSILFGILTLMAITGTYDMIERGTDSSANSWNIRVPAIAMSATFLIALIATVVAGFEVVK